MKLKIFLISLSAFFFFQASAISAESIEDSNLENIRQSVAVLLMDISKDAVAFGGEEVKICFSVDESGIIHLHNVLWASKELQAELKEHLHRAVIETKGDSTQLLWMNVKVHSNR